MKIIDLIKFLSLGVLMGCFVITTVWVCITFAVGFQNFTLSGVELVNGFFGSIVVGLAFSLTSVIYKREDIPFVFKILFQMFIGFTVLFIIAIYLQWMPLNLGLMVILSWTVIAILFCSLIWCCFYIYYYLIARDLNQKISSKNR